MNTIVTENNSNGTNGNSNNGRWTPFREGLIFKEFIETWRTGEYEVDENLIKKVSDEALKPEDIKGSIAELEFPVNLVSLEANFLKRFMDAETCIAFVSFSGKYERQEPVIHALLLN